VNVQELLPHPDAGADPVILTAPVGTVVQTNAGPWGLGTATFDSSLFYRFRLSRVWDARLPRVNFLLLNPSTADAFMLDPTVRRCLGFAHGWSAGALEVTNAFAWRSTAPAALKKAPDPVGAGNDEAIVAAALAADLVVVAWGAHATYLERGRQVGELLASAGVSASCLHRTGGGHPGHPLYLRASSPLQPWPL